MSGKPAARIGDNHVCPEVTVIVPHVGGPIVEGSENVFINGKPAARVGDMATCVGPTDHIATGSPTVFINGKPAARMGDMTEHGGVIIDGSGNVFIGDSSSSVGGGAGGAKVTVNSEQLNTASQFQETAAPEEKESQMAAIKEYIGRVVRGEILSENLARYEKLLTDAMAGDPEASREMIEAFAGFGGVGKVGKVLKNTNKGSVIFKSTKEATEAANNLGFKKIKETVHGQAVFKKGRRYITRDVDSHNGGAWKMAFSVKDLGSKSTRSGTFSADLKTRIGD